MMGATHRATGLAAGACVAAGVRSLLVPSWSELLAVLAGLCGALLLTLLAGRASMWPDLDHSRSTATLEYGWISGLLHEVVEAASIACWEWTATEKDRRAGDFRNHRGLTHFGITAVVFGTLCGVATWQLTTRQPVWALGLVFGYVAALVTHWGYLFFERGKRKHRRTRAELWGALWFAVVTFLVVWLTPRIETVDLGLVGPALGVGVAVAVATGMLAHDLGDSATLAGDPFWWPLKINGQRYYAFHIRRKENLTRTTKDSPTEARLRLWSRVAVAVAVLGWFPGVLGVVVGVFPWQAVACSVGVC